MAIANGVLRLPQSGQPIEFLELVSTRQEGQSADRAIRAHRAFPAAPLLSDEGSRARVIARGIVPDHVRAAATFIDEKPIEVVKEYAGTSSWAKDAFLVVGTRRYPAKIIGVIAKRMATGEVLDTGFANTRAFLRALASIGFDEVVRENNAEVVDAETQAERDGHFDPSDSADARERALRSIVQRRGRTTFRNALLRAYGGCCAVTGCDLPDALEAAHIAPYLGGHTDDVSNGLLLRADIHTLFDLHLIAFDPDTRQVRVSATIAGGFFADKLKKLRLRFPKDRRCNPNIEALRKRLVELK